MRFRIGVAAFLAFIAITGSAQAIDGTWAVRQIKRYVDEDCNSPEARRTGFKCLGWDVYHCFKLSDRKVRCSSYQEYLHNGHRRTCYFKTSITEWPNRQRATLNFSQRVDCFNESL